MRIYASSLEFYSFKVYLWQPIWLPFFLPVSFRNKKKPTMPVLKTDVVSFLGVTLRLRLRIPLRPRRNIHNKMTPDLQSIHI